MPPSKPNLRSSSVKRILQEQAEFLNEVPPLAGHEEAEAQFVAAPLEEDVFEWHVTVRGAKGTDYDGGIYHLRITLPPTYPLSAPDILLLTPSGRFETNKKICIDGLTSFHQGSWRPAWGVRTAVVGLVSFWNQAGGEAMSGVGGCDLGKEEKRRLAGISGDWTCPTCAMSNREIMQEHVKTLKEKRAKLDAIMEEGKAEQEGQAPEAVEEPSSTKVKVEQPKASETSITVNVPPSSPSTEPPIPNTPSSELTRAFELAADNGHPDPPLSAFNRFILTPFSRSLPICYTLQFVLLTLFLPTQLRHRLPPKPDRVLLLDALIHLLAITCTYLLLSHFARGWGINRMFYKGMHQVSRGLEAVLGVKLGMTKRLAEQAGGGGGAGAVLAAGRSARRGAAVGLKPEMLDALRMRRALEGGAVAPGAPAMDMAVEGGEVLGGRFEEL